jgi:Ca-activated chloride channel family protein
MMSRHFPVIALKPNAYMLIAVALLAAASMGTAGLRNPPKSNPPNFELSEGQSANGETGAARKGSGTNRQRTGKEEAIKIRTDLVIIDAQVIDRRDQVVFDLFKKEDFVVFEDNVKQEIAQISRGEEPVSLGLVIDASGSMTAIFPTVCASALDLVRQMKPDDEAFVSLFTDEPELVQDFTSDKRKLEAAIGEPHSLGNNVLLDAIIATADYAKEKAKNRRKVLIVFSDGQDSSMYKEKEALEAIRENEVQVYFVGILGQNPYGSPYDKSEKRDKELLLRLANGSAGGIFFPKSVGEIRAVSAQIIYDLRAQYALSYYPTNDKRDGSFRTIKVILDDKGKRKLIVRAKQGYYAGKGDGH